jgi:hypothetical protein
LIIAGEKKNQKSNSLRLDEFTTEKGDMKEATRYATTQQHQKLLLKACGSMKG